MAGAWHADLMGSSVQSTSALPSAVRALSLCGGAGEPAFPPPHPGPPPFFQHLLGLGIFSLPNTTSGVRR